MSNISTRTEWFKLLLIHELPSGQNSNAVFLKTWSLLSCLLAISLTEPRTIRRNKLLFA